GPSSALRKFATDCFSAHNMIFFSRKGPDCRQPQKSGWRVKEKAGTFTRATNGFTWIRGRSATDTKGLAPLSQAESRGQILRGGVNRGRRGCCRYHGGRRVLYRRCRLVFCDLVRRD